MKRAMAAAVCVLALAGCKNVSFGDSNGHTSPPTAAASPRHSGWVCYKCKGLRLVWVPRAAAPPLMPGGIEVCPRCKGQSA